MHVNGLGSVPNIPPSAQPGSPQPVKPETPTEPKRSEDQVEISAKALAGEHDKAPDVPRAAFGSNQSGN